MTSSEYADEIVRHVRGCNGPPLPPEFAAGTSDLERSALSALGGACRQLLEEAQLSEASRTWPEEVQTWLRSAEYCATGLALPDAGPRFLAEAFGLAYSQIVSGVNRRALGTFFTPSWIVDASIGLAASLGREAPDLIVDPGAGVGAYSLRALERWPMSRVLAVDVNVVTLGLLATASAIAGPPDAGLQLLRQSYFDVQWDDVLRSTTSALFLGNPPYTRHQELDAKTKQRAAESAGALVRSGLAGLSAHFLATTLRRMRPCDTLVLLMPSNWLHCHYGRELREHLWAESRRVEIHTFQSDVQVFPDARVGASLVGVGPTPRRGRGNLVFVERGSLPTVTRADRRRSSPDSWGLAERTQSASSSMPMPRRRAWKSRVTVRRGVATGANEFFLLTDKEASRLPGRVVLPVVSRIRDIEGDVLDARSHNALGRRGSARWLFVAEERDLEDERVAEFVAGGRRAGVNHGELCSRRGEQWFDLRDEITQTPILLAPMSKAAFRVLRNELGAVHTNSLYGITPEDGADVDAVVRWLRSDAGQRQLGAVARHLGSGLMKLEPRAVQGLLNPAL